MSFGISLHCFQGPGFSSLLARKPGRPVYQIYLEANKDKTGRAGARPYRLKPHRLLTFLACFC
jgi:hypothetical protein